MIGQIRIGQDVTRISPLALYKHAAEDLAGTGINHYDSSAKQVRHYRELLKGVLMDKYPLDPHKSYDGPLYEHFRETMDKVEFELSDVPEFREKHAIVEEAIKVAIWDVFFLALFSLVFFIGSVMAFLRYDVRWRTALPSLPNQTSLIYRSYSLLNIIIPRRPA